MSVWPEHCGLVWLRCSRVAWAREAWQRWIDAEVC